MRASVTVDGTLLCTTAHHPAMMCFAQRNSTLKALTAITEGTMMPAPAQRNRKVSAISLPGLVHPHDLSSDRQFSMNLARGLEVLRAFSASSPLLGNREIADRTGLPKPTVSRLTYTLTLLG